MLRTVDGGKAQHVAHVEKRRGAGSRRRPLVGRIEIALLEHHLVHDHALHVHADAHLGEEVRRHRDLDVRAQRRLHAQALQLEDRRNAVPHVHLDRESDRDLCADVLDLLPGGVGHPGHVDEQVIRSDPDVAVATRSSGELVKSRPDAERREDMRRNLEVELPPDRPGLVGRRISKVDLAAHDHMDKLVAR